MFTAYNIIYTKVNLIKPNSDRNYSSVIDLAPNRILFGVKGMGKM